MRYYELITEDFKSVTKKFIDAGADSAEVKEYIAQFKKLNVDHKLDKTPADKNIDVWGKRSFADFKKFVDITLDLPIFLPAPPGWQIYIPVTKTQSCVYTHADTHTTWCTAKPNQDNYEDYFLDKNVILIYCFRTAGKAHWAIACHKDLPGKFEFFDSQQKQLLTQEQFDSATGLNSAEIIKSALSHAGVEPARAEAKITSIPYLIRKALTPDPALERQILVSKNAQWAYKYAGNVLRAPWPAGEPVIAQNAQWAYLYALGVLKKRFPAAEPVIAQNAEWAFWYAQDVLKKRFPAGEPVIAQNAEWAYEYALKFKPLNGWPAGEPVIAQNAEWALYYALNVLKAPWPAGEPAIAKDAHRAFEYARFLLKKRFPAGEPVIAQNAQWASYYARYVLKDPKPNSWGKRYLAQHK
jgi:lambda repressor-like predicted transcriptional regulator